MAFTVAIAGKGGTGKTTLAALLIRYLREQGGEPILAVDADPNANLGEALGMRPEVTIAEALDDAASPQKAQSPAMTKEMYIEYRLQSAMVEGRGVDLLVMGGPEGPGCYCYANNLLRRFMDELSASYRFVVMDNEAGLEHLSRRTTENVDTLIVTSDATVRGLHSAARIDRLASRLKTRIGARYLVVTKAPQGRLDGALEEEIAKAGMSLLGIVPFDESIVEFDMKGRPLVELAESSPAVGASREIFGKVLAASRP